jgi:iron complex outermembrane recepter protein
MALVGASRLVGAAGAIRPRAALAALILTSAASMAATAQVANPRSTIPSASDEPKQDTGQLEQVTVTARYTNENLQTTPVAITAVTGEQLQDRQLTNVTDLGRAVPNLFVTPGDANEGMVPTVSMRGVSAGDSSYATEPAVGIYVDDVYHNTMVGSALDLNDLERVEVKRGPQGTLSGFANIAGTISLFSKPPKGDDSGYFEAGYGSFNELEVKGAFDTTIAPNLFMRISGQSKRQEGYVAQLDFTCEMNALGTPRLAGTFSTSDNSAGERGCKIGTFGGTNLQAGRVALRYLPTDGLEINFSQTYSVERDDAAPEVLLDAHPSATDGQASAIDALLQQQYGIQYDNRFLPPAGRPYSAYTNFCRPVANLLTPPLPNVCGQNGQGQTEADTALRIDYDITDKIHLKAIGAYTYNTSFYNQDTDLSVTGMSIAIGEYRVGQTTGELRINGSSVGDRLNWVGGVFFLNSTDFYGGSINYLKLSEEIEDRASDNDKSGFLHAEYKLTNKWSISAGVRYSDVLKTYTFFRPGLLELPTADVGEHHVDWLVSTNYQITDDIMGYATVATGSRPPGLNVHPATQYQVTPFPGEKLTNYEGGIKTEFFDHRLRLNLTGFYSDYKVRNTTDPGYQCLGGPNGPPNPTWVPTSGACGNSGFVYWYISVGKPATIRGVEFELSAEPVRGLLFNVDGGYNHFKSGVTTPGQPGYIYPGNFPQPEWNVSAGVQYTALTPIGMFTPRLDLFYTSEATYGPSTTTAPPTWIVPGQTVLNGQITYNPTDSKWSVIGQVTNITNKYYYYDLFGGSGFELSGNVAPPREFFIKFKRDFAFH